MPNMIREKGTALFAGRAARTAIGAVILIVLANALYALVFASSGEPYQVSSPLADGRMMKAIEIDARTTAVITSDSRLMLLEGQGAVREKKLEGTVTDMALSADKSKIYVGTGDRKVFIFDLSLAELSSFNVNGRVIGLDAAVNGELAVAYGIGQYTDRFWVGLFDETGEARYKTKIGFDVTAVAAGTKGVYFGTADSKVGYLSPEGDEQWRTNLIQPITRLSLSGGGELLAGDDRGNIAMISDKGKVLWINPLSEYPITMAAAGDSGHILAGDKDGKLFVLDAQGYVRYQANVSAGSINSLAGTIGDEVLLLTDQGKTVTVSLSSALDARRMVIIQTALIIVNAVLAVTAICAWVWSVASWRAAAVRFGRRLKRSRTAYMLLLPSIILILIFNIAPTLMAVFYSFTNFSLKEPLKVIGLDNFIALWSDHFFWVGIWNMFLILLTSILKEVTVPLLIAELIFWLRSSRMKYLFRTAYVVPSIVPGVVGILLWKMMYEPETGMINQFLGAIGLDGWKRAWLGEESIALWSIIMAGFPFVSIFAFLIYFGGLIGISKDIYDSSSIDGVGTWGRFWKIDLPMIRPQLRLILFFTFIGSIQGFANIFLFTRGGPGTATYVPGLQMYNQISNANFGYASAIGFVLAVFILAGSIMNLRFSKQEGV
ncbi:ABC transporter permease subunit [Paenibacillus spongiae]|uniref:ABC transporter permease subunit n=1 Tax=Paenibacillus spongiae TaxID=2909671 RepID=A0ABY5S828_9BACL|nr:PQQ-binding-like beta-propeller repeat protein [Paenibacillus spongiae]UVI29735.1 ABC transporter permease subunit [Paenibacillus spongiae]